MLAGGKAGGKLKSAIQACRFFGKEEPTACTGSGVYFAPSALAVFSISPGATRMNEP